MLQAVQVPVAQRERMPGTVHVDGTARPQTVEAVIDPLYHRLLEECGRRTGVPAVLNTSFTTNPSRLSARRVMRCGLFGQRGWIV